MSAHLNVFPNARPPLLGAGEDSEGIIVTPAVAGLSGDVDVDITADLSFLADEVSTTDRNANESGSTGQSFTITYGQVKNKAQIQVKQKITATSQSASITIHLRRGDENGTIIASQGPIIGTGFPTIIVDFAVTEVDRPIGSQLYTVTFLRDALGNVWRTTNYSPIFNGEFVLVDIDDTHVGFIQSVAIAGKQINAADSHRTHEQSVLPG